MATQGVNTAVITDTGGGEEVVLYDSESGADTMLAGLTVVVDSGVVELWTTGVVSWGEMRIGESTDLVLRQPSIVKARTKLGEATPASIRWRGFAAQR